MIGPCRVYRCRLAAACVLAAGFFPLGALAGTAISLGPAPIRTGRYVGRVSAIACSPTLQQKYYVAGADGGVWLSTSAGSTWTPLTDDMPTQAIGALELDPTNEEIIYAGTGEANYANHSRYGLGLYKSIDGGATWTHLAESTFAGRCFSRIVINPQNPQILYAAVTRAGGFPEMAGAKGHPLATGPVGVFRSDDGGTSWQHLTNGLPNLSATDLAMDPSDPNTLYAGIGRIFGDIDNGIYKTTDGGVSWTRLTNGLPADWNQIGRTALAVAPAMPARIYALIANASNATGGGAGTQGTYRSDDGGATWTQLPLNAIQASYGWYLAVVTVHPTDPDIVVMGGLTLHRSTNAGATWDIITPPHVDIHALEWDAGGRLMCGDDGGVHRSSTIGDQWRTRNEDLGIIQFYPGLSTHPSDDMVIFGGAQDNGSNRRDAATQEWTQVFGGDGGWTQLDQVDPQRVFVEFQGTGNLYRSTTDGIGFTLSSSGISGSDRNCFLPPYLIDPADHDRMLYATHRVYQSTNGGSAWTPISADVTNGGSAAIRALAQSPADPSIVYAATNDGNIAVSDDGGFTFNTVLTGLPDWPRVTREMCVDPNDARTMYLATASFGQTQIRRTRDAGQTWEALDQNLPDIPVNVIAVDSRPTTPVIYAGTDAGVMWSIDDGGNWYLFGDGMPNATVVDLRLEPRRRRLLVGTMGRGAWAIDAGLPGDLNFDGEVDLTDLAILLSDFDCIDNGCTGDANGDGVTDLEDLAVVLANFGH